MSKEMFHGLELLDFSKGWGRMSELKQGAR